MFASDRSDMTPAQRAHIRRTLWLLLAYAVILPPLIWLRAHRQISDVLLIVMAAAAALPVLGIFASWGRYLSDERDEYHQVLTLRRIAVATNATMGAAVVVGLPAGVRRDAADRGILDPLPVGRDPGPLRLHQHLRSAH